MTPEQLREYAETLILEHAREVEFLTVFEMAEEYGPTNSEISDGDAIEVLDLVQTTAIVTVSWPDEAGSDGAS